LNYDAQGHPGFPSLTSRSHNLSSVLLRMLLIGDDPHFQKEGLIDDVGTSMDKASLAEKSCYSAKWMDTWSALEIITASPGPARILPGLTYTPTLSASLSS
jgi:hypothetical protein